MTSEMGDQFADELQILGQKVISIRLTWKDEANEVFKTQFATKLHDPYLAPMACNLLDPGPKYEIHTFPG